MSIEEWVKVNPAIFPLKSGIISKSRRTGSSYSSLSVSEALKEYAAMTSTTWIKSPTLLKFNEETGKLEKAKPEKELTEKQLFSKLKKELKEVKNLIN